MTVRRFDAGSLKPPEKTPEGFLRVEGHIARAGVLTYHRADGTTVRELVPPDEAFHVDSLKTFALLPVTNTHPAGLVTAGNAKQFAVGSVGEARKDGEWVAAPMLIHDADAIASLMAGRSQLSCGYSCDVENTPGVYEGQRYDGIQRKRRGNHVALVDSARAGSGARVRLDAGDAAAPDLYTTENPMPHRIRIDGLDLEVTEAGAPLIAQALERERTAQQAKLDASITEVASLKKARDELQAKLDSEKGRADAAEKARADAADPVKLRAQVAARVALEVEARKHLGADVKLDGADLEIKKLVIAKLAPAAKLDGQSEAYIAARYDAEIERAPGPIDQARAAAITAQQGQKGSPRVDANAAREQMINDAKNRPQLGAVAK